jgi:beta-lactamase class A
MTVRTIDRRNLLLAGALTAVTTAVPLLAPAPTAAAATRTDTLRRRLADLDFPATVSVGLFFDERHSKQSFGWHPDTSYFTASVVKVDILAALLLQTQRRGRALTASQRRLASDMIRTSSNAAATTLYGQIGKAKGLAAANRVFKLDHTHPNARWGLSTTTARNQVRLLGRLCDAGQVIDAERRRYARSLMYRVTSSQDWGVSAARRKGESVLLKNGWMPSKADHQRWVVSSVGRIGSDDLDLRIAILTRGHGSYGAGVKRVEKVADLVRDTMKW